nr:MAG TPA: hypothetical protein [Caudoviricetes sp.]
MENKEKKNEKIITGKVVTRKKSIIEKTIEMFLPEGRTSLRDMIIEDIIVPTTKNIIADIVNSVLFGEAGRSRSSDSSRSRVSYSSYYNKDDSRRDTRPTRSFSDSYDDIILENRGEAELVIDRMREYIDSYGIVTVAELYEFIGVTKDYTTRNYGWTNLDSARVNRIRDGYLLVLPQAMPIN